LEAMVLSCMTSFAAIAAAEGNGLLLNTEMHCWHTVRCYSGNMPDRTLNPCVVSGSGQTAALCKVCCNRLLTLVD
jgi:hypothetical protein